MNRINPKKLLNSKWTAVTPLNKEEHFIVTKITFNDEGEVLLCVIEAVMSHRECAINWVELKDDTRWLQGWK